GRWPTPPTRASIPIAGHGTARTPRMHRTRRWPRSSSARRAGRRHAAALLERSALLTPDPASRARRALSAAQTKYQAGAFEPAVTLLAVAEAGPLDELQHARIDLLRAQTAFTLSRGNEAPALLLDAARRLEPLDARLARETYLDALRAANVTGRLSETVGV